jgi:hypothetical protein
VVADSGAVGAEQAGPGHGVFSGGASGWQGHEGSAGETGDGLVRGAAGLGADDSGEGECGEACCGCVVT